MASPTPVLPLVGSTIVPPGLSSPRRSASSIITRPMRSLTDPPGLRCSSLPRIVGRRPLLSLESRTSGVLPTRPRTFSAIFTAATLALPRLGARHDLALREADGRRSGQIPEVLHPRAGVEHDHVLALADQAGLAKLVRSL